jgi:hypothetical protein
MKSITWVMLPAIILLTALGGVCCAFIWAVVNAPSRMEEKLSCPVKDTLMYPQQSDTVRYSCPVDGQILTVVNNSYMLCSCPK